LHQKTTTQRTGAVPGNDKRQRDMATNIIINGIAKESEKAICLICLVSYNANAPKERNIWMPKSVCKVVNEHVAEVADWFLAKTRDENAFHGYRMNFETL